MSGTGHTVGPLQETPAFSPLLLSVLVLIPCPLRESPKPPGLETGPRQLELTADGSLSRALPSRDLKLDNVMLACFSPNMFSLHIPKSAILMWPSLTTSPPR